jgi:predicted P-loop ATPase
MQEFAAADKGVCAILTKERRAEIEADFSDIDEATEPQGNLKYINGSFEPDKKGNAKESPYNRIWIVIADPNFRAIRYDLFAQRDIIVNPDSEFMGTHPGEVDDTALAKMAQYIETQYGLKTSIGALTDKMLLPTATAATDKQPGRGFNPVIEFIGNADEWDGTPRLDTLLIDYLGAENTPLNRAISRKVFVAAVARAINPGCKFDYCLVLQGEQGIGKSTFISVMAGNWLGSLSLSAGAKEQCETLTASWIVEIPELKGMRQADTDTIKDLISRQSDDYRAAYARKRTSNARHCIFIASTNDNNFLKDTTGNRRFWVVPIKGNGNPGRWAKQLAADRAQIWREARHYYDQGEELCLSEELEREAKAIQNDFTEAAHDPLRDYLQQWLDILIWPNWESYSPDRRKAYYMQYDDTEPIAKGSRLRDTITICEIQSECPFPRLDKYTVRQIGAILKSLGWEYVSKAKRIAGYKIDSGKNKLSRYYKRPESDTDNTPNIADDESDI